MRAQSGRRWPRELARRAAAAIRRPTKRGVCLAVAVVAGLSFVVAGLGKLQVETDISSFLPTDDPVVESLDDVARSFGGDPVAVLIESTTPRQQLDEKHLMPLLGLEGQLSQIPGVATVYGPGTVLNQIAGHTQKLLAELAGLRDGIRAEAIAEATEKGASDAEAQRAGESATQRFDARYGSLLVEGLPAGLPTLHNARFVQSAVFGSDGEPKPQWRFVVPTADSVAILVRPRHQLDAAATRALVEGVRAAVEQADLDAKRVTVAGVPVIADALGAQVERDVPILGGVAVLAVGACFLLVPWTRWRRRLLPVVTTVTAIAATLSVFGWAGKPVSLGVVAFLSVLLGIGSYYPIYLVQRAKGRVVAAVVLATVASFSTLLLSPMPFVRDLGMTLAIGVLLAVGIGTLVLGRAARGPEPEPALAEVATVPEPRSRHPRRWVKISALAGAVAVAASGWLALPNVALEGSFHRFLTGLPGMSEAARVESIVGSSAELDIVLRGDDVLSPEAIAWAHDVERAVVTRHGDQMRSVVSPPGLLRFLGHEPTGDQIAAGVRLLPPYLTASVFRSDSTVALLGYGVRFDDLDRLAALRDDLDETMSPPPAGFEAEVTGLPMAAVRGNELLSNGRVLSNTAGILAAGLVLAIVLARRADAARAVLAAAIATGAGLAVLAVLGIAMSPLTVAFGSLTAAIACEFTVMFAESARRRSIALRRSVLLATATSAVGFAVLAASPLTVIREFGLLLAGSVLLSMVSAWVVVAATGAGGHRLWPDGHRRVAHSDPVMVGANNA